LKQHGTQAVFIELAALAVLTLAAIVTDGWWAGADRGARVRDAPARGK
jgi:hypothetical protein